jgi:hypothetical protein
VALLLVQLVPQDRMEAVGVGVHRPLGVLLLAVLVLTGPTRAAPAGGRR